MTSTPGVFSATRDGKRRLRRALRLSDRPLVLFVGFFSHDKQPRGAVRRVSWLRDTYRIDTTWCLSAATKSGYYEVDEPCRSHARRCGVARCRRSG